MSDNYDNQLPVDRGRPTVDGRKMRGEREPIRHLTGRGGIGLVTFHLSRQKIDFAVTPDNSRYGDVWIATPDNRKYGIEVKTCRRDAKWQIKTSQITKVDFYVLVSMDDARCFVLTAAEIDALIPQALRMYGDVYLLHRRLLSVSSQNAWGKLTGAPPMAPDVRPVLIRHRAKTFFGGLKPKTVRKTLANGTVRIYKYPRILTNPRVPEAPSE